MKAAMSSFKGKWRTRSGMLRKSKNLIKRSEKLSLPSTFLRL